MKESEIIKGIIENYKDTLSFEQLRWLMNEYDRESSLEEYRKEREQNV